MATGKAKALTKWERHQRDEANKKILHDLALAGKLFTDESGRWWGDEKLDLPLHRLAVKLYGDGQAAPKFALYSALIREIDAAEHAVRGFEHDIKWKANRVCDGCEVLRIDSKTGKPYPESVDFPRWEHDFHVSSVEMSKLKADLAAAKQNEATLKRRLATFEETIRTQFGFPAKLYASLHEELRPFVVRLILGVEARHLFDGDKLVTRSMADEALEKSREEVLRWKKGEPQYLGEMILGHDKSQWPEKIATRLAQAKSCVAMYGWFIDRYGDRLPAGEGR